MLTRTNSGDFPAEDQLDVREGSTWGYLLSGDTTEALSERKRWGIL